MNNNNITSIDQILVKLPALRYLYMNHNLIIQLGNNTFKYNTQLKVIYLLNNKIKIIYLEIVNLKSVTRILLSFNLLTTTKERPFNVITGPNDTKVWYVPILCEAIHCNCAFNWEIILKYTGINRLVYVFSDCVNTYSAYSKRFNWHNISESVQNYVYDLCPTLNLSECKQG